MPYVDVPEDHWAYHEIVEASVTHNHRFTAGGEDWI